ncbi:hypothetical protein Tco_0429462 [Tanacetum coccineum]
MSSLKFKVFLVYEELEYGVLLPNDVNYSNLVRYVKKKFKVGDANQISLSYNIGSISLNIIDDDDVRFFVNEVSGEETKGHCHDVEMEWNIYVSYKKAWRGKHIALASSQGCLIESFAQLPFYCYNLKKENEGTVTNIQTDDNGRFKMFFIGFGVTNNLVAVGMDRNNLIIPIATGVSQGHYAITLACNTVFPNSFHGYCCLHLMMNYGMQSNKFKELYWKTCKAYMPEDFKKLMSDIHDLRPDAHQKLVDAGIEKWSRAICRGTYEGLFFPVKDVSTGKFHIDIQQVLHTVMGRNVWEGEGPIINKCGRCGVKGHNRTACTVPLPKIQNMVRKKLNSIQREESSQGNNYRSESQQEANNYVTVVRDV